MGNKIIARKSGTSLVMTIPADIAAHYNITAGTELELLPYRTDSLELRVVKKQ